MATYYPWASVSLEMTPAVVRSVQPMRQFWDVCASKTLNLGSGGIFRVSSWPLFPLLLLSFLVLAVLKMNLWVWDHSRRVICVSYWNIICNINKNPVSGNGDHVKAGICGFPSRFLCVYWRHLAHIYKYKCIISSWQHGHQVPSAVILAGYYFWSSFLCFVYSITANRWFK